jgi:hypothetical protein
MADKDRADDMVFAGTSSAHRYTMNPVKHLLRGTSVVLLVDLAILCYITTTIVFQLTTSDMKYSVFLLYAGGYVLYRGYRNQRDWAYPFAIVILYLIGLCFGVIGLLNCVFFVVSVDVWSLLIGIIMLWAAKGSIQRARMHNHPTYKAAYFGQENALEFQLQDGEMLAACPNCFAVLAIEPTMLSSKDKCPHCNHNLVSSELEKKYASNSLCEEH